MLEGLFGLAKFGRFCSRLFLLNLVCHVYLLETMEGTLTVKLDHCLTNHWVPSCLDLLAKRRSALEYGTFTNPNRMKQLYQTDPKRNETI